MMVKCAFCPNRNHLGNYIRQVFIDGKYQYQCRDCERKRKLIVKHLPE